MGRLSSSCCSSLIYRGNARFRSLSRCWVIAWRPGWASVQRDLSTRSCLREEMLQLAGRVGSDERAIDVKLCSSLEEVRPSLFACRYPGLVVAAAAPMHSEPECLIVSLAPEGSE